MKARIILVVLILPLAIAPTLAATGTTHTVSASNFFWSPENATIAPGDSVDFVEAFGTHTLRIEGEPDCELPCTRTYPDEGAFPFRCGIHAQMQGSIRVGTLPTVSISSHAAGDTVQGVVTVQGAASHPDQAIAKVEIFVDGNLAGTTAGGPAGASIAWSIDWETRDVTNAPHVLLARATDALGRWHDATLTVTVANPPNVDLRPLNVNGLVPGNTEVIIAYSVRNQGNAAAGPFTLTFEYQYKGTWRPFTTANLAGLNAFSTTSGRVAWNSGLHLGTYPIRILVDSADAIAERDETNNVRTGSASWVTNQMSGFDPLEP